MHKKEVFMIKTVQYGDLGIKKAIAAGETSRTFLTSDGSVLKIFDPRVLMFYNVSGTSLEKKILYSTQVKSVPEIVVPKRAVYYQNNFIGYTTDYVEGISYNEYDDSLSISQRKNLSMYAFMYHKLESIVKRGNKEGIVFPDLCSCDNIILRKDGSFRIIDYDGLQVGKYGSINISTSLGDQDKLMIPKYQRNLLFNSNLDKKSLINLYFLDAFNINLETVGMYNPYTDSIVTLDDIFNTIGLDDDGVKHKVWKCFQPDKDNEFLDSDVDRIADKYDLEIIARRSDGALLKHLVRK